MRYRHHKGAEYTTICEAALASDSATVLVVYYGVGGVTLAMPKEEFYGMVQLDSGKIVPMFEPMD
jgi:hypothetical protein